MRGLGTAVLGAIAFVAFGALFSILLSGRVQWLGMASGAVAFFVVWLIPARHVGGRQGANRRAHE